MKDPVADVSPAAVAPPRLWAEEVTLAYDGRVVSKNLDVTIPTGRLTVILGPNACGKTTLLRSLARLITPSEGHVVLDGKDIRRYPTKEVARRLGLLPQSSFAPFGITVADLVARGRFPHQRALQQWSQDDEVAVARAMAVTNVTDLAERSVDELSGGQRQRVWLAMVLAQETPLLLLDEPTTYLDIAHQLEVLELCRRLNRREGRTLVLVLHDLNQAARYADHIIVMRDGAIVTSGAPHAVLTPTMLAEVFGLQAHITADPITGAPMVIPIGSVGAE